MTENKEIPFTTNGVDKYRVKEIVYANGRRKYIPEVQLASYVHFENESQDAGWINIATEGYKSGYFLITDAKERIKKRKEEHQEYAAANTIIATNYLSEE